MNKKTEGWMSRGLEWLQNWQLREELVFMVNTLKYYRTIELTLNSGTLDGDRERV